MASTDNLRQKRIISISHPHLLLWIPIWIGIGLRIYGLSSNSIWYDEALTVFLTRQSLMKMVSLLTTELNPPLWEILEWWIVRIFTPSEISYRVLSLISGIFTVVVAQRLLSHFQVNFTKQFLAVCILSIGPYQLWMAQDARVYALMSCLYLLGFWFIIQQKWLGVLACFGLLFYSNSAAVFCVVSLVAIGLLIYPDKWRRMVYIGCASFGLFIPWFAASFGNNLSGSYFSGYNIPPVNNQRVLEQVSYIFLTPSISNPLISSLLRLIHISVLVVFFVFLVVFLVNTFFRREDNQHEFVKNSLAPLLILIFFPLIMIIIAAWFYRNGHLILYRSFSPLAVPLVILIAVYSNLKSKFSSVILIVLLIVNLSYHFVWTVQEKGGFLKETIQKLSMIDQPSTIIFHATANSLLPFQYYLSGATHYLLDADLPAGFLVQTLQQAFDLKKISTRQIPSGSFWIIWAKDVHLPPFVEEEMNELTNKCQLMCKIYYPQAAAIDIYYCSP